MDERLHRLDAGMDIAFERAKAWARYAKEIITYVEKRAHLGKLSIYCMHILIIRRSTLNESADQLGKGRSVPPYCPQSQ